MEFIKKVFSGFAIGLGFAIACALVMALSIGFVDRMYGGVTDSESEYTYREFKADETKLVIENEKSFKDKDGIIITGTINNTDDVKWSSISIELELFDKKGNFVHECSEYISQTVRPNQRENFKLKCKSCKNTTIPEFVTYKLRIVSASAY